MQLNDPLALRAIDGMIEDATLRLERAEVAQESAEIRLQRSTEDVELAKNAVEVAHALRDLAQATGLRVVG